MVNWHWLEDLGRDLHYAARALARQKAFAVTVIATLALGIGANTAIFSVVSGVILRPLPFADPERLVQLRGSTPLVPRGDAVARLPDVRARATSFEALVAYSASARYLHEGGGAERVMTVSAEKPFFSLLGVAALRGRTFGEGDGNDVAVLSEAYWRARYAADPSVLGRTIVLDGEPFTVIGIMDGGFQFPYGAATILSSVNPATRTDVWIPLMLPDIPNVRMGTVTGRLKPGVAFSAAQEELAAVGRRLAEQFPESNRDRSYYIEPLDEAVVSTSVRRPLLVLIGAVLIVLLLACANVANLSLVRATIRTREVAVRAAIGADRWRLVRQFMAESVLISAIGGGAGLVLGWWGTQQLADLVRTQIPRVHEVDLDWRVFAFLLTASGFAAIASGLPPAFAVMNTSGQAALQEPGARATMSRGQRRVRDGLVVIEVALACMLAVGATLLVRELYRLRRTDIGIMTGNVSTFHVGHRMTPRSDIQRFYDIAARVEELPGVRAAGFTQLLPLQNWGWTSSSNEFRGPGQAPGSPPYTIEMRYVTPGYFRALGIPVRGRAFSDADTKESTRVVVINQTLARRAFGDADPVGTQTTRGTVVGVMPDVRQIHIDKPASPELYFPIAQNWSQLSELGMSLVVSTAGPVAGLNDRIRTIIQAVDPNLAVFDIKTMTRVIEDSLGEFTIFLRLMTAFAALALLLALTGTYGVIAYVASSRLREFAIRSALGAGRGAVTRLVLGQALRLTAVGVGLGIAGAVLTAPLLQRLPVSVGSPDPMTLAAVAAFIAASATAACMLPALRAGGVNPMAMLRNE